MEIIFLVLQTKQPSYYLLETDWCENILDSIEYIILISKVKIDENFHKAIDEKDFHMIKLYQHFMVKWKTRNITYLN